MCFQHQVSELIHLVLSLQWLEATPQPMRYVRGPDAITVAWRVTTRIRSFTRVTLTLRWMGLGFGQPIWIALTKYCPKQSERDCQNALIKPRQFCVGTTCGLNVWVSAFWDDSKKPYLYGKNIHRWVVAETKGYYANWPKITYFDIYMAIITHT